MPDLERALQIAVQGHTGQKDRNGAPYILHPLRVMMRCVTPDAQLVALLHDLLERTSITLEQLKAQGFSDHVLLSLRLVTHLPEESYGAHIDALMTDPIAREVKIADLEDNADIRRLRNMDEAAVARLRKYHSAYLQLIRKRDRPTT